MRTVVFDLDGTLADTSGDLIAAANACFREMGVGNQLDASQDAATALRGGRAMLTLGLSRLGRGDDVDEVDRQYPLLLEHYAQAIDHHTVFYPGAIDAVKALRANGYKVAVCTNKPEHLARMLLENLEVLDHFDALIGADTLPVRKPDPGPYYAAVERSGGDVTKSVMIGDTQTDHDTARAAGVASVLVTFGPGAFDVSSLGPDALLTHFDDLHGVVVELIG